MASKAIFFDLDGTLTDSGEGIINCATLALEHFGLPVPSRKEMGVFVGPPLDKTFVENPLKGEYFLPSVISALIEEGKARVKVLRSADKWYGVTYQADKPVVVAAIAEKTASGLYPDNLWEGK